jgi:hypothetical protein
VPFFFFPSSSSGFRLPDVSSHPRRRRASGALGQPRGSAVCSPSAGPDAPRAPGTEKPRLGRSLRASDRDLRARRGAAWVAGTGCCPPQRRHPAAAAAGPARTFRASCAAQLPPQRALRAPSLHPCAGPRGRGKARSTGEEARGGALSPRPTSGHPGLSSLACPGQGGAQDRQGKRCGLRDGSRRPAQVWKEGSRLLIRGVVCAGVYPASWTKFSNTIQCLIQTGDKTLGFEFL